MSIPAEPAVQAYVRLVRAAEAAHSEVSNGLFVRGISASQFSALKAIRLHGRLSQKSIGEHLLKSGGNITVIVDHLERDGLVARERCTQDRRVIYVSLTDAGTALFDEIYPDHLDRIRSVMSCMSEQECSRIIELLNKFLPERLEVLCVQSG